MQRRTSSDSSGAAKAEKAIGWRGSALDDVRAFPDEARREAGYQLYLLQQGEAPDDWKPMAVVGPGTIEVRIHVGTEHRVFVVSKFEEAVYVLHAFDKTSQRTSKHDVDLARQRYRDILAERRER
jgi:phage-related protein